ncbi:MAG TPA: TRAP transporter substrate-binding protein DctP [Candidatus Didemnitutus sp.]|nr:TRAP transporter substrate-binding protein DctP [Candidatus Didemnitutus sp.]
MTLPRLFCVLGLAVLLAAPASFVRAAETVTIRIGTILPTGTPQHQLLLAMFEQWRKDSDGTVKVVLYPDGRLGGESEMVKKMRIKQLSGGILTTVGLSEIDRGVAGLQMIPLGFRSWAEVDYVREKLRPMLEERLHAKGYEVLFWADAGWVRFFSKEAAIRPSDYQKMKLFAWSGDVQQAEMMRAAGYRPVPLETTDILLGLNTDMINAIPVPPIIALAGQFYGPAPHMLDLNWSPIVGATVVRSDVWDKIPAEIRAKLHATADAAGAKIRAQSRQENDAAVKAMQARGLHVHQVTPEAAKEWDDFYQYMLPRVRGKLVPEDIFDAVQKYLAEVRANPGATP